MALSDIQALVDGFVRDASATVSTTDRDTAIGLAVQKLSEDKPRPGVEDVVAADPHFLPLPASWEIDFSDALMLEYPIGNTPPTLVDQEFWSMYRAPTGQQIQVLYAVNVGDSVRVSFTMPHVCTALQDTVLVSQREAVAAYAASLLLEQLASKYSNDEDSTIAADSVDHRNKGKDYAARAKSLRALYFQRLDIRQDRLAPAGTVVDLDLNDSRGRDRLTHSRRYR